MARTIVGSWTVATMRRRPPQRGQAKTSRSNTRRIRVAQVEVGAGNGAGAGASCGLEGRVGRGRAAVADDV